MQLSSGMAEHGSEALLLSTSTKMITDLDPPSVWTLIREPNCWDVTQRIQLYKPPRRTYSRRELIADSAVNWCGAALSWPMAFAFGYVAWNSSDVGMDRLCFCLFCVGLVATLNLSALHHHFAWDWVNDGRIYGPLDHVGINLMIIGCFAVQCSTNGSIKVFWGVVGFGLVGIAIQAIRVIGWGDHFKPLTRSDGAWWTLLDWLNMVHYVLMGAAGAIGIPDWVEQLPTWYMLGTLLGAVLYIAGVYFLVSEFEFHQACWHVVVFLASSSFYATYFADRWSARSVS